MQVSNRRSSAIHSIRAVKTPPIHITVTFATSTNKTHHAMKKKRILFLFVTLFASTLLYSQVVGVKTNLVMDAMKIINLGAEVGLSKKLKLDLYANMPWGIWPELKYHRFKGNFFGAGISYGYQWILAKHWNLEGNIGVGYARVKYEQFECKTCGEKVSEGHKNYLGPTKAAISLIYLF